MIESKVQGKFVNGTIKSNPEVESSPYMAFIAYAAINEDTPISAKDVRTFAHELLNIADKADELNGVE
ncbi:hypothetical protein [Paenibacillus odorifer]|uniref:hypothetical protein n=1 Tax=Paenibacillus odorifer TaxID=189426 RepID=UPI0015C3FB5E|nr:hypothetical protein [Paenibacillus odorifer]